MNVEWTPAALDDLAEFYVALPLAEQDDVARTVLRVNAELSLHPETLGESREENCRVWCVGRLAVRYQMLPSAGVVTVYNATLLRGFHR